MSRHKHFADPPPDLAQRFPPRQRLALGFPTLTAAPPPEPLPAREDWTLRVFGLAAERTLTWAELLALPQSTLTLDLHCVTHWSKLDTVWTGIRTCDLLAALEVSPQATHVMSHAHGDYSAALPLDDWRRADLLLAHTYAGEPLEQKHGGPLRLVAPHRYFWKSVKWLEGLEFMDRDRPGYWEARGYHHRGDPWRSERWESD